MSDRSLIAGQLKPRSRPPTEDEIALFIATCERTGLDPLARQIYAQYRTDSRTQREQMAIQATIDGFRVVAERSGDYLGGDAPQWCGTDGVWRDVWLEGQPAAARITVHKAVGGQVGDTTVVAHWREYAPTGNAAQMWTKMPALMLAKVAEALALRRAFPMVLSGIYTSEEMAQVTPAPVEEDRRERVEALVGAAGPSEKTAEEMTAEFRSLQVVDRLKALCKAGKFNWGVIKECYAAAHLTPPTAFADVFTTLSDEEADALQAALSNRMVADQTDVPYPADEVAPPGQPPTNEPDLPWASDTADVGTTPLLAAGEARAGTDTPTAGVEAGTALQGSGDTSGVDAPHDAAPAELTPLPVGDAPIDALLAAAQKEAEGGELTDEERDLLENGEELVNGAFGSPADEVPLTEADTLLLDAFVKSKALVGKTAVALGEAPDDIRAAVADLKKRVGLRTNVALLEWAERRLA